MQWRNRQGGGGGGRGQSVPQTSNREVFGDLLGKDIGKEKKGNGVKKKENWEKLKNQKWKI